MMWKTIFLGFVLGISLIIGLSINVLLVGIILMLGMAATLFIFMAKRGRVFIGELEAAVVINRHTGNFSRFLRPGNHWIDPFSEMVTKRVPLNSQSVSYVSEGIQTCGGIPVNIKWQVGYSIKPQKIGRDHLVKMARAFAGKLDGMMQKRVSAALQHIIGDMTPQALTAQGSIKMLERQVKQICRAKLDDKGVHVSEILIQSIQLPRHVRESLESAHERALLAEQEAQILERLHAVIRNFSADEIDRLMELERIQLLGRNGVTMMMPLTER